MNFENVADFVKAINAKRLESGWYFFVGTVCGKTVEIKGYATWLQIYQVDLVHYGNCSDRKVGQFKDDLMAPFEKKVQHDYHRELTQ
jgi:hypothetical protein